MMNKRSGFKVMASLIGLVKPLCGFMVLAIVMGIAGNLAASFITVTGAAAVLKISGADIGASLGLMFAALVIFAVLRAVLRYLEQASNHYIAFKLLALIRDKVFQALRRLCPAKLEGRDRGNLISVITSDIELLEVFYAHTISPCAIAAVFSVIMCLYIGSFYPALALIALAAYAVVGVVIPLAVSKSSGDDGIVFRNNSGALSSFVLESLRGLSQIIQYSAGSARLAEINKRSDELSQDEKRLKKVSGRNSAVTNTVILIFDLAMLFTCAALYKAGKVDFSGVVLPTVALMSSFGPVVALADLGSTLQNTFAAGNRVLDIMEETPVTNEITNSKDIEFSGAKAENVCFSYGGEDVLKDISLDIDKGKIIGISGKSGSGKSTLLKLLMRFWEVEKGKISLSGVPINEINTASLRDNESLVTQETHLFHDSIKNNLLIAKLDADDEEIVKACKKASVHDFIMSLPNGYDTSVGELGDTLSGGERQRIGLVRAFLHDSPFMLLDEPTSNLDSLNEAVILKSLFSERENKTVLLVSHRKSTMKIADEVYSVERGRMS